MEEESPVLEKNDIKIPVDKLEIKFVRSSGPGGQNVNKLNTKAEVRFNLNDSRWIDEEVKKKFKELHPNFMNAKGEVIVTSQTCREQKANLNDAIMKLRDMIYVSSLTEKERKFDIPAETQLETKRRILDKKKRSDVKKTRNSGNFD